MSMTYTTTFYGNFDELKKAHLDLKEHAGIIARMIGHSFDGAFEDEPEEYDKMHEDIRINVEVRDDHWSDDYSSIDVSSYWHYKEFSGQVDYHYSVFEDDHDPREFPVLITTFYEEFNTELHVTVATLESVDATVRIKDLYMAPIKRIDLSHFDKIRAY